MSSKIGIFSSAGNLETPPVPILPTISTPDNESAAVGETATFTVVAIDYDSLQWQENGANIPGENALTYTTPVLQSGDNGALYRCIATNAVGSTTGGAATLTVTTVPLVVFTKQPTNKSVTDGSDVTFTVVVDPVGADLQWKHSDGGAYPTFSDVVGETGLTLTLTGVTELDDNGDLYKCVAVNSEGDPTDSNTVQLSVGEFGCTPLPANSAAFLQAPSQHVRDGIVYEAVPTSEVFPDGQKPFVCAYGAITTNTELQAAAGAGFTVVGSWFAVFYSLTEVLKVADANLKMVFPLRDYVPPLDSSVHGSWGDMARAGAAGAGSALMNDIEAALEDAVDLITSNPIANDTVIMWGHTVDDALSNPDGLDGEPRADYWKYAEHMYQHVTGYDPKSRPAMDLPQIDHAYRSYTDIDSALWQEQAGAWGLQDYWSDDGSINKATKRSVSRAAREDYVDRMVRLSAYAGATPNGKVRLVTPYVWAPDQYNVGQTGYTAQQKIDWDKKSRTCDMLIKMMSGAHGFSVFQYNHTQSGGDKDILLWEELISTFMSNDVITALLWGVNKTDITKTALNDNLYDYQVQRASSLDHNECVTCTYRNVEMIKWKSVQFKGDRYLCVTNMMPNEDVYNYWVAEGSLAWTTTPGTGGKADFFINSRFNFPASMVGVQCVDVLTGDVVDISGGAITVNLGAAESRVYKFSSAPGYCTQ